MLALPGLAWLVVFAVLPFCGIVVMALLTRTPDGEIAWRLTPANLRRATGFTDEGFVGDNLRILARTVLAAGVTACVACALGAASALFIATRAARWRAVLLLLVAVPLCTNIVVRTTAWTLVLGPGSPLTGLARALGLVEPGYALFPSMLAVYVGLVSCALPLAILPIYASAERLDWSLVDAARDLGASRWRTVRHAIVPQLAPGLAVAFVLTFVPTLGMFVVPDLLGGAKHWLYGNLVQQQFASSRNWPYGAALAVAMVALTVPCIVLALRRSSGGPRAEERGA